MRPRRHRRNRTTIIVVAAVVVAILVVTAVILLSRAGSARTPSQQTTTYEVRTTSLTQAVTATGTFQPAQQLSASFPAGGTVTAVKVAVGDRVTKGQVLATEDSAALAASLQSARAAVSSAQSQLNTLSSSSATTNAQLTSAQATLAADQAKLAQAQSNYDGTTLTSPISGIVAKVDISTGGVASGTSGGSGVGSGSAGQSSGANGSGGSGGAAAGISSAQNSTSTSGDVVVVDTSGWLVDTQVTAADLPSLKAGQAATMLAPDGRTTVNGTVQSVGQVASTTTASSTVATFPVVVAVTEPHQAQLFIGSSTTVSITTQRLDNVLAVPTRAITQVDGGPAVRLVTGGTVTDTPVTVGRVIGQQTEITKGLSAGDRVQVPTFSNAVATASPSAGAARSGGGFGSVFGRGGRG
ncbi:efflux RND transporter periplasmic adaptor subunit [Raineyella antarctica]|nr:HlyD family efflux transporter periplasmic adaptor subunit [Raineyella antarctica]